MPNPIQLFQTLTQRVMGTMTPQLENAPAIDIWEYAEPAGEEPDPLKRNVLQWRRLISSVRDPLETFPGQPVDIIGFVQRSQFDTPNQFTLARPIIRCCLADTVPLGLIIYTPKASQFPTDSWLRVRGRLDTQLIRERATLVVMPKQMKAIATPKKQYINGVF